MLIFIDESIQTHAPRPHCALTAVSLKEDKVRDFTRGLFNLKKVYWKTEDPFEREIKGTDLLTKRQLSHPKMVEFVDEIILLCKQSDIKVFATVSPAVLSTHELFCRGEYLTKNVFYLLQRVNRYVEEKFPQDYAILMLDAQHDTQNERNSLAYTNFLYKSQEGLKLNRVLVNPLFVNSRTTPGIQIADLVAYCISGRYSGRNDLDQFYNKIKEMEFVSTPMDSPIEGVDEFHWYGIKYIKPKEDKPKEEIK